MTALKITPAGLVSYPNPQVQRAGHGPSTLIDRPVRKKWIETMASSLKHRNVLILIFQSRAKI